MEKIDKRKRGLSELRSLPFRLLDSYTSSLNHHTIEYWQTYIFYAVFLVMTFASLFMLVPNSIYALRTNAVIMALLYVFVYVSVFVSVFLLRSSIRDKTVIVSVLLYILSVSVTYRYGPASDGSAFLYLITFLCSLFIGLKSSLAASLLNFLVGSWFLSMYKAGLLKWDYFAGYSYSLYLIGNVNILIIQVIFAIAISQLIRGVQKTFTTINRTKEATILGLAKLAEYRDTDTGLHLERIREYAAMVAGALARTSPFSEYVTQQYIDDIIVSSALHDIGKVGVPDTILLKPGRLSPEEFEIMKKHTELGKQVIEQISNKLGDKSFLDLALRIAQYHHEKWDGTGYPDGVSGEDIPLSARIIALADVYDALTTKRIYKQAFTHEKAIEIIAADRGKHFDPILTDIFLKMSSEFDKIRIRLSDGC